MKPETLPEHAEETFRFLFEEHGAHVIRTEESQHFGDWLAHVEADRLFIRLGKDRGQPFLDITSSYLLPEWFDMEVLGELILGHDSSPIRTLEDAAAFLHGHYSMLADMLGKEKGADTAKRLSDLQHDRARKLFPEWFEKRR